MTLRDLLSKLKWDPREDFHNATISYLDRTQDPRGATIARLRSFRGGDVVEMGRGIIVIKKDDEISHIPFHRVREVRSSDGRVRWSRET